MVIVFILELSGGISGYVLRARTSSIIQNKMKDTMKIYTDNKEIAYVWDKLQQDVKYFSLFIFDKFFIYLFIFYNLYQLFLNLNNK